LFCTVKKYDLQTKNKKSFVNEMLKMAEGLKFKVSSCGLVLLRAAGGGLASLLRFFTGLPAVGLVAGRRRRAGYAI
jgi:hypothetical protein